MRSTSSLGSWSGRTVTAAFRSPAARVSARAYAPGLGTSAAGTAITTAITARPATARAAAGGGKPLQNPRSRRRSATHRSSTFPPPSKTRRGPGSDRRPSSSAGVRLLSGLHRRSAAARATDRPASFTSVSRLTRAVVLARSRRHPQPDRWILTMPVAVPPAWRILALSAQTARSSAPTRPGTPTAPRPRCRLGLGVSAGPRLSRRSLTHGSPLQETGGPPVARRPRRNLLASTFSAGQPLSDFAPPPSAARRSHSSSSSRSSASMSAGGSPRRPARSARGPRR